MIACSLLRRVGFRNVGKIGGGFDAWQKASSPVTRETLAAA